MPNGVKSDIDIAYLLVCHLVIQYYEIDVYKSRFYIRAHKRKDHLKFSSQSSSFAALPHRCNEQRLFFAGKCGIIICNDCLGEI